MPKPKIPPNELALALELFEALPDLQEISAKTPLISLIEKLNPANPLRDKLKNFQFEHNIKKSDYRRVLAQRHGGRAHKKLAKEEIKGKEGYLLGKQQTEIALKIFEKYAQNSPINIIPQGMTLNEAFKKVVPPVELAEEHKNIKFDKTIIKDKNNNIYVLSNSVLGKGNFGEVVIGQAIHVENNDTTPAALKAGDFVAVKKQSNEDKELIEAEFAIEQKATGYHFGSAEHEQYAYSFLKLIRGPELDDWVNSEIMGYEATPEKQVGYFNEFEQGFMQFVFDKAYYDVLREAETKAIQQLSELEKEVSEATALVTLVAKRYKKISSDVTGDKDDIPEPEEFQSMEDDEKLEALQKELEEKGFIVYKDNATLKKELYDLTVAKFDKTQKKIDEINLSQPLNPDQTKELQRLQKKQDMDGGFREFSDKYNKMLADIEKASKRIKSNTKLSEIQIQDKIAAYEKEKLEELYIELEQTVQVEPGWRIKQGPAIDALESKLKDLSNQEFVSTDKKYKITNKDLDGIPERVEKLNKQLSESITKSSETGRSIDIKLHPVVSGTNIVRDSETRKAPTTSTNEQIIEMDIPVVHLDAVDNLFPENLDLAKVMQVCINIASDVDELHQGGILHRDLKPGNILIDWQTLKTRIIDFGISLSLNQGKAIAGRAGSPGFWAPEIYTNKSSSFVQTPQADIWSLGATYQRLLEPILIELTGVKNNQEAIKKGLKISRMEMTGTERVNNIRFNNPKNDPALTALNQFLEVIEKAKKAKPEERENINNIMLQLTQATQTLQVALEKQLEVYEILSEVAFTGKMEEDLLNAQKAIKTWQTQNSAKMQDNVSVAVIEKCIKGILAYRAEEAAKKEEQLQQAQAQKQKEEQAIVAQRVLKPDPENAYQSKKQAHQELVKDITKMKQELSKVDPALRENSILALKIKNAQSRLKDLEREIKVFEKAKFAARAKVFETKDQEKRPYPVKFTLRSMERESKPDQQRVLSANDAKAEKIKSLILDVDNINIKIEQHKKQSKNQPLITELEKAMQQAKSLLEKNADPEMAFRFIDIKLKAVKAKIPEKGEDPQLASLLFDVTKSFAEIKSTLQHKPTEENTIKRPKRE